MPAKERQDGKNLSEIDGLHVERYRWASARIRGPHVLDCACGVGYGARLIAEEHPEVSVLAVDNSLDALRHARRYFPHERVEYLCRDMSELDLPGRRFDSIVSLESLEHVRDPMLVLARFLALLEDGGNLLVSLPIFPTVKRNKFHLFEVRDLAGARAYFSSRGLAIEQEHVQDERFGLFELRPQDRREDG